MELNEALDILKENDYIVEDFNTQDMKNFKHFFKNDKMDELFSIESDSVFRGGFSFWIVSKKNPKERYLIKTHSNVIEQYIRPDKVGEVKYGDCYDIILILKHYIETNKLVSYVHGTLKEKYDISVFSKVKIRGAKVIVNDDSVELDGMAFDFKIYDDLRYELKVLIRKFGKWCTTGGSYKTTVLDKTPEELKAMILWKCKDFKWKMTSW